MLQSTHIAPSHRRLPQITWKDALSLLLTTLLLTVLCIGTNFLKECIPNLVLLLLFVSRGRIRKNISKPLRLSARSRLRRIWDLRDLNASSTRCGDQKWSWNKIVSKRPGGFAVFFLLEDMGRVGCWFQRYIVLMFTLRKKEEMMEVCYVGRDDAFFFIFFSQTGCFNQLGKGNWVVFVDEHSWARIYYFHIQMRNNIQMRNRWTTIGRGGGLSKWLYRPVGNVSN